ncbi:DUF5057 domain-containing protein [Aneurinibacillus uraniidurans]|uniref:DUF5057 domain-containing protein n=1 Tax=Aneurinibacillus uraniidurans TaxID=2966586 RepID=UPI002349EBBB|nr:DUF5057 domain-containing protein [Aneurinibacillus sp. B1]WCN38542.1 DUF5057 domain-containing protein [Aneurinibacillus sp. B1]
MKRLSQRMISLMMVVLLIIGGLLAGVSYIWADDTTKIRVLEITDKKNVDSNGEETGVPSELGNLGNKYVVTTISMKRFVALREELDGKYDVIYIGSGTYSTTGVQGKDHNTKAVMNDITNLKAKEIREKFIEKGQPVVLHEDIFKDSASKLKANFYTYKTNPVANVKVVTKAADAIAFIQSLDINMLQRPHMEMTKTPDDYMKGSSTVYKPGDTVSFGYRIGDYDKKLASHKARVNLYLDMNFDKKYEASEMLASVPLSSATGELNYTLTRGYSGMRYWKLEIEDLDTHLKTYETGVFRFRDRAVEVRTLQVTQDNNLASSLLNTNNMKASYLNDSNNPDYKIKITVKSMSEFNTTEYKNLNGNYDMLIFGFADSYNNAAISEEAAKAVKTFIATRQGVMFTHDTIFKTGNNWVKYFMYDTGQIAPMTDLGYGAPNTSKITKKMNDGMINQYPFQLGDNVAVNTTHNQYYTLDLEDETVVPWYNIVGSKRDQDDSWNHYYTYSKGSVTYSGTGHTNTNFPDQEQRLFVNTIYRAFIGANHSPEITAYTPKNNDSIRTIDPLEIVWKVEDFDLTDQFLDTKVTIYNEKGEDITPKNAEAPSSFTDVRTGTVMKYVLPEIPASLKENGGKLTIKIEANDKRGAKAEPVILTVNVKKIIAKLVLDREREIKAAAGQEASVHYTVAPLPITEKLTNGVDTMPVTSIQFRETFPAGVEVTVPAGFSRTGTVDTGYTVTKTFDNIVYRKQADGTYKADGDGLAFELKVKPTKAEKYVLADSKLSYTDLDKTPNVEAKFPALILNAESDVTGIQISPKPVTIQVGDTQTLFAKVLPDASMAKNVVWDWQSNTTIAEITGQTGGTAVIKGLNPGKAVLRASIKTADGQTLTDTCEVTVIPVPVKGISLPPYIQLTTDTAPNNEPKVKPVNTTTLVPNVFPINATNKKVSWSSDHPDWVSVDQNGTIRALMPGKTATITAKTADGGQEATCVVYVMSVALDRSNITMNVNESTTLVPKVTPPEAPNQNLLWSSSNPAVVTVDGSGKLTTASEGTAVITTWVQDSHAYAQCQVTVSKKTLIPKFTVEAKIIDNQFAIVKVTPKENIIDVPSNAANEETQWFKRTEDTTIPPYETGTTLHDAFAHGKPTPEDGSYEFIVPKGDFAKLIYITAVQPNGLGSAQEHISVIAAPNIPIPDDFLKVTASAVPASENRAAQIAVSYEVNPDRLDELKNLGATISIKAGSYTVQTKGSSTNPFSGKLVLPTGSIMPFDKEIKTSQLFKTAGTSGEYTLDASVVAKLQATVLGQPIVKERTFSVQLPFNVKAKENLK